MNLHAAGAYVLHLLKSRGRAGHGVHSPFMFSFVTEVIGGRRERDICEKVESLRREMMADWRRVKVRDLGAGSAVIRGEERSVRQIASTAALPARNAALLARIAGNLDHILSRDAGQEAGMNGDADPVLSRDAGQEGRMRGDADPEITADASPGRQGAEPIPENRQGKPVILELGTSLGISTLALALGAPHRRVITVEGCPELAAIARDNLQRHGAINTEVICGEFSDALSLLRKRDTKIGMAFIDGNHRGPALAGYVKKIREMGDEMIIVADDIRLNREMIRAWELLTADTTAALNATASLETFRFGILFFLPNLTPGRYRIRY
ncbi:MAG: class I SAM-dependent methyltransferase [Bacteroidales bacterium]|nr:class I SAM-dependent methyltransferase [Bacteroidales bacterium]